MHTCMYNQVYYIYRLYLHIRTMLATIGRSDLAPTRFGARCHPAAVSPLLSTAHWCHPPGSHLNSMSANQTSSNTTIGYFIRQATAIPVKYLQYVLIILDQAISSCIFMHLPDYPSQLCFVKQVCYGCFNSATLSGNTWQFKWLKCAVPNLSDLLRSQDFNQIGMITWSCHVGRQSGAGFPVAEFLHVFTQTNEEHPLESMVYKFILQITASTGGETHQLC